MRTRNGWTGGMTPQGWPRITAPRAWYGPVAALAAGAVLSVPAIAIAPAAGASPFGSTAPGVHQTPLVRGIAGSRPTPAQAASAIAALRLAPANGLARQSAQVTARPGPSAQPLRGAGFDGMLVAAIGTAVAGAGWLLLLAAGRRLRRRSR